MYGKQGPVALAYIKNNTRKRNYFDWPDTQADESVPKPNPAAPPGMSDDNKALFNSLAQYIDFHMQNLNKRLDSLNVITVESQPGTGEPVLDAPQRQDALDKTVDAVEVSNMGNQSKPAIEIHNSEPVIENLNYVVPPFPEATPRSAEGEMQNDKTNSADGQIQKQVTPGKRNSDITRSGTPGSVGSLLANLEQAEEEAAEVKEIVKLDRLKDAMQKTESLQEAQAGNGLMRSISSFVDDMSVHKKDTILDVFMAIVILMNSVVIGISMDHDDPSIEIIDLLFTLCFIAELCCKFYLHGFTDYFAHCSNIFDFMIVAVDVVQIVLELMDVDLLSNAPAASLFRVARLVRLVRLIRLARLNMLDDLVALISGMVGGMSTLLWSIVLFFLILYITSLLFREFFGRSTYMMGYNDEDMTRYFDSVPRCMLTVFRFFFGDFSTISGLSLFEGIQEAYGSLAAVLVCGFFFMITIGLFNVIAAIFVESTLAAANHAQILRKTERMNDEVLWSTRLTLLVRKIFEYNGNTIPDKMSQILDSISDQAIPEAVFQDYMKDKKVVQALNDLEIDESDHKYLFDILDNDNTGSIFISQLSDGLERLRGDPRRSDIICVDLMVRSIQQQTDFLVKAAKANVKTTTGNRKVMSDNQALLSRIEDKLKRMNREDTEDTYEI